jgi:hypothetical protein
MRPRPNAVMGPASASGFGYSGCRPRTEAADLRDQGGFWEGDFDVKCQDLHVGHR